MNWIDKLERRFGSWAIPNLAVYLIGLQAIGVILLISERTSADQLFLHGSSVLHPKRVVAHNIIHDAS
ncbi:MAG: hypothetical protein ACJZ86_04160 [Pontiellaceae bacterium]